MRRIIGWAGLVVVALTAACGGGPAASPAPSVAGPVTIMAATGALGTFLTDDRSRPVYLFAADTTSTPTCTGDCARSWPPVLTVGQPVAGSGLTAGNLSTTSRPSGGTQVSYNGHPLYYFAADSGTDPTGQGVDSFGARWWIVDPAGTAITTPADSGGGGY
jgi:predicted lipoprotein with Yx(FWY)xxD motif